MGSTTILRYMIEFHLDQRAVPTRSSCGPLSVTQVYVKRA
jgi:hypothetical protein